MKSEKKFARDFEPNPNKEPRDYQRKRLYDWEEAQFEDDFAANERRYRAVGFLDDRMIVVIFTLRDNNCRVISMRKATSAERRRYERHYN